MTSQIQPLPSDQLYVTKAYLARRYGVSSRTINDWMRKRILPFVKTSPKLVRFNLSECDIAIREYNFKSIYDHEIQEELDRRAHAERQAQAPPQRELDFTA